MSESYKPDNVTLWSGIDYFCGYPHYLVTVKNDKDSIVWASNSKENPTNFTSIENAFSYPPSNYSTILLNSTDNSDYTSDFYIITVDPILDYATN